MLVAGDSDSSVREFGAPIAKERPVDLLDNELDVSTADATFSKCFLQPVTTAATTPTSARARAGSSPNCQHSESAFASVESAPSFPTRICEDYMRLHGRPLQRLLRERFERDVRLFGVLIRRSHLDEADLSVPDHVLDQ